MVDYQCPACRSTAVQYRDLIASAENKYSDAFAHIKIDFPLDGECNQLGRLENGGSFHPAGCEAAAAVRLARIGSPQRAEAVVEWLWQNQEALTPEKIFAAMISELSLDLRGSYSGLLPGVVSDVSKGRQLRVGGTPAFFLNGRRLPALAPDALEAAIDIEMRRVQRER